MMIVAEWYEYGPGMSTCMHYQRVAFEGETREEIDAQIRARVPNGAYQIVGCHNNLRDYASYAGEAAEKLAEECPYGFADSPRPTPPTPPSLLEQAWLYVLKLFARNS